MISFGPAVRPLSVGLWLVCAASAAVIGQRLWQGTQTDALLATPARKYDSVLADLTSPSNPPNLEPVQERALFHASRNFYVAPVVVAASVPPAPDYRLTGVLVIPRKPSVATLVSAAGAPHKVRQGDDLDGWTVTSVESRRVVLQLGANTVEIASQPGGAAQRNASIAPESAQSSLSVQGSQSSQPTLVAPPSLVRPAATNAVPGAAPPGNWPRVSKDDYTVMRALREASAAHSTSAPTQNDKPPAQ